MIFKHHEYFSIGMNSGLLKEGNKGNSVAKMLKIRGNV
jgi:hypothetical protein